MKRFYQRRSDRVVMPDLSAVGDVPDGEVGRHRQNILQPIKRVDDGRQGQEQLTSLLFHIATKQRFRIRRDGEKPSVKLRRSLCSHRQHEGEAVLHELDLAEGRHDQAATAAFPKQSLRLLEGPPIYVGKTLERIMADERHDQICFVSVEPVADRVFADWSMANLPDDKRQGIAERMNLAPRGAPDNVRTMFLQLVDTRALV